MARVIRQNITFRNQRIGVVRADRSGEQLERDIQSSADNLIKNAFNVANQEAQQKGIDMANNLSANDLKAIDPETGNLKVLENSPLLMGLTQRRAFRNVVEKRFRYHIEQDIKNEANRLATELQNDDKMVSKFQNQFENYVKGMKKPFGENQTTYLGYINDLSESYLASTKVFLTDKKIKRDLALSKKEFSTNLVSNGNQLNAVILTQGNNIDKRQWGGVYQKTLGDIKDNKQANVIDGVDVTNAKNALNSSVLSAYSTNIANSIRSLEGSVLPQYNTKPKIEKTLRAMQDAVLTGNNIAGLDDTHTLLTITELDGSVTEYTAKGFVEFLNKESQGQDKSPFINAFNNAITSVKNEQVNQNAITKDNLYENSLEYKNFNNNQMDVGNANSPVNSIYLSADNNNTSNLLNHIINMESKYDKFATGEKDSPLKETGAKFTAFTDSSGVNVKGEVLNRWFRGTGIYKVLSKINQTEGGPAIVDKAQIYMTELLMSGGDKSQLSVSYPKISNPKLQKEFDEAIGKIEQYYSVNVNGFNMDSFYSQNDLQAKLKSIKVDMTTQQTDIKAAEVSVEQSNNENVSANQNNLKDHITDGLPTNVNEFGTYLNKVNADIANIQNETYKSNIKVGNETISIDTKGVDVTTRNSLTSEIEGAVSRSFIGSVDQSFDSDTPVTIGDTNTTVGELMSNPIRRKAVYNAISESINSNQPFKMETGSPELDTILQAQYGGVVDSINNSSEGMKKAIMTKIRSANTLLTSEIEQAKAQAENASAISSVINALPNSNIPKSKTVKATNNLIYAQNGVGQEFFLTPNSLEPNNPATKMMYDLAKKGVFDETFMSNVNDLLDGKIQNPSAALTLMSHIRALSYVVNESGGAEINMFAVAKGDIGANVSDETLVKLTQLNHYIDVMGLNEKSATNLSTYLVNIRENKANNKYNMGEAPYNVFTNKYADIHSDSDNKFRNLPDVIRHHMVNTHNEDSQHVITRMSGVVKLLTDYDPTLGVETILQVVDKFYNANYMDSKGIILDPSMRNSNKVHTNINIDVLIPKNELETFQAPPDENPQNMDTNLSRFNGMQKQDVWLTLIQETLDNKDAMSLYGEGIEFILDNRGTTNGAFDFGNYNPSTAPKVVDENNITGTRTVQSERAYLNQEIGKRSGIYLSRIKKQFGQNAYDKALKERDEISKRLDEINKGLTVDAGQQEVPVYGTKDAPVKVFLVPMKNITLEKAPDSRGADELRKVTKFRVMRVSNNGLELEPLMIKAQVGDDQTAYVPYVVSYRGSNDISPLDYLTIGELQNAHKVRNESVVNDMQPKTFTLDDL